MPHTVQHLSWRPTWPADQPAHLASAGRPSPPLVVRYDLLPDILVTRYVFSGRERLQGFWRMLIIHCFCLACSWRWCHVTLRSRPIIHCRACVNCLPSFALERRGAAFKGIKKQRGMCSGGFNGGPPCWPQNFLLTRRLSHIKRVCSSLWADTLLSPLPKFLDPPLEEGDVTRLDFSSPLFVGNFTARVGGGLHSPAPPSLWHSTAIALHHPTAIFQTRTNMAYTPLYAQGRRHGGGL